jgi:hypothetical protein
VTARFEPGEDVPLVLLKRWIEEGCRAIEVASRQEWTVVYELNP